MFIASVYWPTCGGDIVKSNKELVDTLEHMSKFFIKSKVDMKSLFICGDLNLGTKSPATRQNILQNWLVKWDLIRIDGDSFTHQSHVYKTWSNLDAMICSDEEFIEIFT